ncbi:MAG: 50S ribosomal protein L5 [Pedobacter sp.]|nr:MAG: 50S ribosomal protein L5 [Pedobacter sp.]
MSRIKTEYQKTVREILQETFNYKNPHEIPKLEKIVINMGLGLNAQNKAFLQKAVEEIRSITGQHPIVTLSKKSIAGFKIREKMTLGLKVTLRKEKMYAFYEKLTKLVFPRKRDFRGVGIDQFDDDGNLSVGIHDQLVFPEIEFDNVEQRRGCNITIVTTAKTPEEGFVLLKELGFPFAPIEPKNERSTKGNKSIKN